MTSSLPEVESSRTSLASTTHFEVLSLASKVKSLASKPQVLENGPVLGSRTALIFEWLKFCKLAEKLFFYTIFFEDRLKKIFEDLFFENTCVCVLGLQHSCPWPREYQSSEGLSLALASDLFFVLGPCVLDSTTGHYVSPDANFSQRSPRSLK